MYIYLSDRKRRSYLSSALPQNLSQKSLSFKDQKYLQKTIKHFFKSLTLKLLYKQKFLYEKHIYKSLQFSNFLDQNFIFCKSPLLYICKNLSLEFSKNHQKFIEKRKKNFLGAEKTKLLDLEPKKAKDLFSINSILKIGNLKIKKESFKRKDFGLYSIKQKLNNLFFYNIFTPLSSRSIYIQKVKIFKNKNSAKSKRLQKSANKNVKNQNLFVDLQKIKNFLSFPPTYVNGKNGFYNSIFLYQREQYKTCLNPQVLQKAKNSTKRGRILHEKKKINLFYGQIGKKDMDQLCKKAKCLTGIFEDNLYTLLESRVDVLVHRAGFSRTIGSARKLIRNGLLQMNGKKIYSPSIFAKPGDFFSLKISSLDFYKSTTTLLSKKCKISSFSSFSPQFLSRITKNTLYKNFYIKFYKNLEILRKKEIKEKLRIFTFKNLKTKKILVQYIKREKIEIFKKISKSLFLNNFYNIETFDNYSKSFFIYSILFLELYSKNKDFFISNLENFQKKEKYFSVNLEREKYQKFNILLNVYCVYLLKKKTLKRKKWIKTKSKIFKFFMKNIQNKYFAFIWGYKPLHLEISHKTKCFIYLYKPQKIISPLCMDFNVFRFIK